MIGKGRPKHCERLSLWLLRNPALLAQAGNLAAAREETAPALDFFSPSGRGRPDQRDISLVFGWHLVLAKQYEAARADTRGR